MSFASSLWTITLGLQFKDFMRRRVPGVGRGGGVGGWGWDPCPMDTFLITIIITA